MSGFFSLPVLWSEINRPALWRLGFRYCCWAAGGFLSSQEDIYHSSLCSLPTPGWTFWAFCGWCMYAEWGRYTRSLYLGGCRNAQFVLSQPSQISKYLSKHLGWLMGDDVCRPPQRSTKHHKSFTNEQLCSPHRQCVGRDKEAYILKISWWVGCYFLWFL